MFDILKHISRRFRLSILILSTIALIASAGCFGQPEFAEQMDVVLPAGEKQVATAFSGAAAFAGATWTARRAPDPTESTDNSDSTATGPYGGSANGGFLKRVAVDDVMYRIVFNEEGVVTKITDNHFYPPETFGDVLTTDGTPQPTRFPLLTYAATPFAAQTENKIGLAFPAEVRFIGLTMGTAVVYGWGTLNEDGTRLDGMFGYTIDLTLVPQLLLGDGGDQYPFYVTREP